MKCGACGMAMDEARATPVTGNDRKVHQVLQCDGCGTTADLTEFLQSVDDDIAQQATVAASVYCAGPLETLSEDMVKSRQHLLDHMRFARRRETFVEIGMGCGLVARAACSLFEKVIGVDLELDIYVAVCQRVGQPERLTAMRQTDFSRSDIRECDMIWMQHVLEHIRDPASFFCDINGRMAAEGIVVGQVPMYNPKYIFATHHWFFTVAGIDRLTAKAGMQLIHTIIDEQRGFLSFVARRRNT